MSFFLLFFFHCQFLRGQRQRVQVRQRAQGPSTCSRSVNKFKVHFGFYGHGSSLSTFCPLRPLSTFCPSVPSLVRYVGPSASTLLRDLAASSLALRRQFKSSTLYVGPSSSTASTLDPFFASSKAMSFMNSFINDEDRCCGLYIGHRSPVLELDPFRRRHPLRWIRVFPGQDVFL